MGGVSEKAKGKRAAGTKPPQRARKKLASPAIPQPAPTLPAPFTDWFARRGWRPRDHQLALLEQSRARRSTLLIAPTGAGKTMAGFLPSLISISDTPRSRAGEAGSGLHTLYISPLKALAEDIARNLVAPVAEMGLKVRIETRSGDTSTARRARQRVKPPHILLTTPEQVALMLSSEDAGYVFGNLDTVILDELHALAPSKRGDLLALGLARLNTLAPNLITLGLSATVARPSELRSYLRPQTEPGRICEMSDLVVAAGGADPSIAILEIEEPVPWGGHSARYAMAEIYRAIERHRTTLVFVNTRMQAEMVFQELWTLNDAALPIALHHGSLDKARRLKVEAAMASGALRAVVATSTLDLGIERTAQHAFNDLGSKASCFRLSPQARHAFAPLENERIRRSFPGHGQAALFDREGAVLGRIGCELVDGETDCLGRLVGQAELRSTQVHPARV